MIFSEDFKKTIALSLLWHITIFIIFSFSFGDKIRKKDYTGVTFLGKILDNYDLAPQPDFTPQLLILGHLGRHMGFISNRPNSDIHQMSNYYLKPTVDFPFDKKKITPDAKLIPTSGPPVRKKQVIMFYPYLPYNFLLYFKDRQAVHIELMFNIVSNKDTNYIEIKRKTSSGNLEADLLSIRYINHYLFIQQDNFFPNNWQEVRIDLSRKGH